ncbi:MAG TPA: hypothetical protein VHF69_00845, partial [Candidatus Synoicihabitans sp.]|nr:hypothetical protein [Candidatus Synoicihabitans sp.]
LKLRPGMTANISIILARRDGVLRVANSALRARIPEDLLPPPSAAPAAGNAPTAAAPAAALTTATREQAMAIMQEAGFTPGSGTRPTPEIIARAREIAAARGLSLPERGPGGGGRSGATATSSAPVTRTLYKLVRTGDTSRLEPTSATLGITDGAHTEVIAGLNEGDLVVTGVVITGGAATTPASPNPFGGGRRF